MINAIIFSKNRPAQLDLTLRSLGRYPVPLHISVLYKSDPEYAAGYEKTFSLHKVNVVEESDFRSDLIKLIDGQYGAENTKFTTFFTDDDIMLESPELSMSKLNNLFEVRIAALSLRLGRNTYIQTPGTNERCSFPNFVKYGGFLLWDYKTLHGNFGYWPSVDGSIFLTDTIKEITNDTKFSGPNQYEAHMSNHQPRGFMACLDKSSVVGCCINRVQNEFENPAGIVHHQDPLEMNEKFMAGLRLYCPQASVVGAHQELPLFWSQD